MNTGGAAGVPWVSGGTGPADVTGDLAGGSLQMCLALAVPLWLERARGCSPAELAAMAEESSRVLAGSGGVLQRGGQVADAARVLSHLARGIAITAFGPDGITFAGMHWCAHGHPGCPGIRDRVPS